MKAEEVTARLRKLGKDSYKRILLKHGAREPVLGVSVADLKALMKETGKDHALALELFKTGIYDAMYLAGLMADSRAMTRKDLAAWVKGANCQGLWEYTVAWVAAESPMGFEIGLEWIDARNEGTASAGWATLSGVVALRDDKDLDLKVLDALLKRVEKTIHKEKNRVRYTMNGFVIALGSFVTPLTARALEAAATIGPVTVDMEGTACIVPSAADYIQKVKARGALGRKKKTVKC